MKNRHVPVLLKEVIENLDPKEGGRYIDATLGFGGHGLEIIRRGGRLLGIDWDPEVLALTKERFSTICPNAPWKIVEGSFSEISTIAEREGFFPADGVVFDLGISRWHYQEAGRGFSFDDETLDMRISPHLPETAFDVINYYSYGQLYQIFTKVAQEKLAGPIARALVRARNLKKIGSAKEVAEIAREVYRKKKIKTKRDPATKVFLALRTVVNQELENLKLGLRGAFKVLAGKGRLAVIAFNSNEDRIVKRFFKEKKRLGKAAGVKLIFPGPGEVKINPLSRSAKLRVLIKE